jgi:hypothetical protein
MNYQQLIDLLTAIVAPTTWDEGTGPGQIHECRAAGAIVFAQTREVHAQVKQFLAALRKVRDEQDIRPGKLMTSNPVWPPGIAPGNSPAPARGMPQPGTANQPPAGAVPPTNPMPPANTAQSGGGFF